MNFIHNDGKMILKFTLLIGLFSHVCSYYNDFGVVKNQYHTPLVYILPDINALQLFAPWAVAGNSPAYGGGIVYGLQPGPVGSQVRQLQQQQARQPLPVWTANGLFGPAVYQPPGQPVGRAIPSGYRGNGKVTPVRDQRQRPTAKSGRRPRTSKAVTARPAKRQKQDVDAEIRQFVQRDKHMQRMFFDSALHNDNDEDDGDDDTDNADTVADQNEYVGK